MTHLFLPLDPYDHGMLDVGDGNLVYWETCGNPAGKPAVMVHGGPGQGCAPRMRQMFDPERYRAVLFDQRGCGRSTPHASDPATTLAYNTTDHLVGDMERLREHLGIDRWVVVGGSWGTTLGLVYAERYPDRVSGIMVSAISTTRRSEIDWLYRGVARFFPEEWQRFRNGAGDTGRDGDLVVAYAALMNDPDPQVRNQAAADWRRWEDVVLSLEPGAKLPADSESLDSGVLAFVRLTTHYYSHAGWLDDQAVIRDAGRLAGIPGVLIHGRLDLSCPIETAWELARSWPGSELLIDDHSGHRGSDIKRAWMLETLDRFASRLACTIRPDAPVAVYAFLHNRLVTGSELDGTTESVVANGVKLFVRRFGNPALPMLIVVHGGPTWDHSYLLPAAAGLSDVAHVVLFDLRGCGRTSRVPPVGDLPTGALQPDLIADDVAALVRYYGAQCTDLLGFSYGGGIATRVVDQHPDLVRNLVLASTTAYRDFEREREASADYQARTGLCTDIDWDDPALTGPDAPDGALSRAMAHAGTPRDIWRLDRLDDWHRVLAAVKFSSDWNVPHATGQLRPGAPDNAESVLKDWSRPVLILQGVHDMTFPVSLARRLHAALPASTLAEIPDAAHMAHFDNPQVWIEAIRGFLNEAR